MNGYFIAAGTILILTFIVHIIAGNRTYAVLNPQRNNQTSKRLYEVWLLGRLGFQMISIDLFLSMVFTILMVHALSPTTTTLLCSSPFYMVDIASYGY